MIVIDASALLEVLLQTPAAPQIESRIFSPRETLHAPHLLDLEIAQVLRRYAAAGDLDADRAWEALTDLSDLPLTRYPHNLFLPRIWELRFTVTAYDAAYLALAEDLSAPFLTRDQRLASSSGHRATIEVL